MNFVKPRKHVEEKDAKEPVEKSRRDRYQRSDSARLLLQAIAVQSKTQTEDGTLSKKISTVDSPRVIKVGSVESSSDFKPEELPDGAFYRPKNELRNSQTAAPPPAQDSQGAGTSRIIEFIRHAEYIGTFSVSGSDKEARERQMESQLEKMRSARDRMPVNVIITNSGVKVVHSDSNNVFMEHSLKRIWYATCDPEYCQFSFLAREPKTSAEVQYCHAFVTQTAQQAEELISVIGEAFRSTDNIEVKKPPTFNELIEQQVQQQQAKFRETELEAQSALQQKLQEIATPTPFSERAQFRMEQRRQSEDIFLPQASEKVLTKQHSDQGKPSACPDKTAVNLPGNRRSEIPTRQSTPQSSPLKRNSVPPQSAMLSSQVPSSLATNPLSVLAIKESMESRSSNSKFKGSPVTALKNEIDRRLSIPNGDDMPSLSAMDRDLRKEQAKPPKQQPKPMTNRPLPLPPGVSRSPQQSRRQSAGQHPVQQSQPIQTQHPLLQQPPPAALRHSLDDNHLPRSSSSQIPLSSNARNKSSNVELRNSPKRRTPRPMSEIATSSSGAAGAGGDRSYSDQQQQALLNNFAASFNLSTHPEASSTGTYIYGPSSQPNPEELDESRSPCPGVARHFSAGDGAKLESGGLIQCPKKPDGNRLLDSNHPQNRQNHIQVFPAKPGSASGQPPAQGPRRGSIPGHGSTANVEGFNAAVLRYQNDSPFQNDRPDASSKSAGFESLLCLDRSHIQDEALRTATWYQAGLPREIALEILNQEEVGGFIVRDSSSHPGCYALSVRVPKYENTSGISHYLILRTHRGVKLKGLDKEWSTLTALVTHHTVMRELLPCTLRLPKAKGQEMQSPPSQRHSSVSTSHGDDANLNSEHPDQS